MLVNFTYCLSWKFIKNDSGYFSNLPEIIAINDNYNTLEVLLEAGADPNLQGDKGISALYLAADGKKMSKSKILTT